MNTMIVGPMFSGKSTILLQKIERAIYGRKSVVLVRPQKDDRGYFTHSKNGAEKFLEGLIKDKKIKLITTPEFTDEIIHQLESFDSVFVDEYFMIRNNIKLAKSMRDFNPRQDIYFAGLLSTSENTLFSETVELLPYCEEIIKLNSVCMRCGSDLANYSMFKGSTKKDEIIVGDNNLYECVCKSCFEKLKGKSAL